MTTKSSQSKGGEEHLDQPAGAGPRLAGARSARRVLWQPWVHILSMSFTVQLRCAKFLLIIRGKSSSQHGAEVWGVRRVLFRALFGISSSSLSTGVVVRCDQVV